jgi:hypothetical protein
MSENPYIPPKSTDFASDKLAPSVFTKAAAMFARHMVLLIVICLVMIFVIPRFENMFAEFELKLPPPTLLILAISRLFVHYWYLGVILLPLYFMLLVVVHAADRRDSVLPSVFSLLYWMFGLAFLIAIPFAIVIPLLRLITDLSK